MKRLLWLFVLLMAVGCNDESAAKDAENVTKGERQEGKTTELVEEEKETESNEALITTYSEAMAPLLASYGNEANRISTLFTLAGEEPLIIMEQAFKDELEGVFDEFRMMRTEMTLMDVPPALEEVHALELEAVDLMLLCGEKLIEGVEDFNPALIGEGTEYMNLANAKLTEATDLLLEIQEELNF
ncbi:hypothetical protein IMZ31_22500 (plasmid) [Pontibacillus sp. ALD_SL1]|uniref:hypothetical protein n=1 Tax=Pontibacillus sp. ALD_SL1 TaxID=2777185 RepID=UPI001A97ACF3|nr:hypothetical protein [Pontibacillus sp. ALD_SL1]QST02227.1 hypothetical protein IMZ31_22500 [Pontibacillus sp. ALD_SL1]